MKRISRVQLLLITVPVLLLLCMAAVGAGLYLTRSLWMERITALLPGEERSVLPTVSAPQALTIIPLPAESIVFAAKTIEESSSEHPKYEIMIRYPVLEAPEGVQVERFNRAVRQVVDEEIQFFKDGLKNVIDDPMFNEYGSSLRMDFTPTYLANDLVSVYLRTAYYNAGAAHPGSYTTAFTYDLAAEEMLTLSDLFRPNSDYLELLSDYCIEDLRSRDVLGWEDGALPLEQNYRVWNITPDGLLITFDEYAVAAYALGTQTVIVPYDVLSDLLRAAGPLDDIAHP